MGPSKSFMDDAGGWMYEKRWNSNVFSLFHGGGTAKNETPGPVLKGAA
jgi:hypothetical protein